MNMITKKMKRKDLELDEFSDDFSDFSLSSPARKIRRLVRFLFLPFLLSVLFFFVSLLTRILGFCAYLGC